MPGAMCEPHPYMSPDIEIEPVQINPAVTGAKQSDEGTDRLSQTLEAAILLLHTGDFNQRWDAVKILSNSGEAVIPPLMQLLVEDAETDWELLWFIARILGNLNSPAAVKALIQLLEVTDQPDAVAMAIMALSQCGEAAVAPLADLLVHSETRLLAVQALAQISSAAIVPPLLTVSQDDSVDVRVAVLEAFSHFCHPSLTELFQQALRDPAARVRQAAVTAIGLQASAQPDVNWVGMIQPLLWDVNFNVCAQTATACARIGTPAAVALLIEVLQSAPTPNLLRLEIIRALVWIGNLDALIALQQFLLHRFPADSRLARPNDSFLPDALLAQEIITALGRVTHPASRQIAANILLNVLNQAHPVINTPEGKQQVALSLGQLQEPEAIDPLIHLLADSNPGVRLHLIAALKQFGNPAYNRLQFWQAATENLALQAGIGVALQEWHLGRSMDDNA